jgi:hypothetical protein
LHPAELKAIVRIDNCIQPNLRRALAHLLQDIPSTYGRGVLVTANTHCCSHAIFPSNCGRTFLPSTYSRMSRSSTGYSASMPDTSFAISCYILVQVDEFGSATVPPPPKDVRGRARSEPDCPSTVGASRTRSSAVACCAAGRRDSLASLDIAGFCSSARSSAYRSSAAFHGSIAMHTGSLYGPAAINLCMTSDGFGLDD